MIKEKTKRDKRVNSKDKGDRFERQVCNSFKKAWGVTAYRTPGSGAYTSRQVSAALKHATVGDVVIEELPNIVIECKNYYSLHFTNWFKETPPKNSIYGFWNKLVEEATEFKKVPLMICKEAGSPVVGIMDMEHIHKANDYMQIFETYIRMGRGVTELGVFDFKSLLALDLETVKIIINTILG
jgi:hypothetical protein